MKYKLNLPMLWLFSSGITAETASIVMLLRRKSEDGSIEAKHLRGYETHRDRLVELGWLVEVME